MKKISLFFIFQAVLSFAQDFKTPFEKGNGNQTTTYEEMVKFYALLDQKFQNISMVSKGKDDNGEPIRLVVFNASKDKNAPVILINNGIHPGEPDGIDATMMLMRDLAIGKLKLPSNIQIAAIQCYNISGMIRRGKYSRANQNGPEEYGFRGNARNYDLNRDFIKTDTENAKSFQEIIHWLQPIFFIDNHVSNGADYQYLFTFISTNKERLGKALGTYFHQEMQPKIVQNVEKNNVLTVPYVNIHGDTPDEGFPAFMDTPRYATGYTTLFNIPGTVAETHMLKPYAERVRATYEYMKQSINYVDENQSKIKAVISEELRAYAPQKPYVLQWKLDSTKFDIIDFKGYEAGKKPSGVSGKPRLYYDRNQPFTRKVKFFNTYQPTKEILIPSFYIIPKSENKVVEALKRNKIVLKPLKKDSTIHVESYKITDFKTGKNPYEGHYVHFDTQTSKHSETKTFKKGDYLVSTQQPGVKFLLETLEPEAVDSFFNWNYFDGILNQKEYFSDYVFEDTAAELLASNSKLKTEFDKKKAEDAKFSENGDAQLDWVYKNSPYFEGSVNQYPIYRIP